MNKLKYVVDIQKGKLPKEFTKDDNFPVYLSMEYLRGNDNEVRYVKDENVVYSENHDILILWDGSNAGEILLSKEGVISSTTALLKPKKALNKKFLFYQLKSSEQYFRDMSVGMGIPHVNPQELLNFSFFIPSLQDQSAIANYLDQKTSEIDQLIADKEELLKLYEEEKTAVINEAVTKGINPNVPFKDSGIEWLGEIPKHWEVKKIKWVLNTISGGTPNTSDVLNYNGHIPWLRSLDLNNSELFDYDISITEKGLLESSAKIVPENSVLVAMYGGAGTIGKSSLLKIKASINQAICAILPNDKVNPYYLFYFIQFYRPYWMIGAEGTRRDPNISQAEIRDKFFLFPPIEEQKKIVHYIKSRTNRIEIRIQNTQKLIELLKEYRTALISEVVTGKVKVI